MKNHDYIFKSVQPVIQAKMHVFHLRFQYYNNLKCNNGKQ